MKNYVAIAITIIIINLKLFYSGILAGIYPDACTQEVLNFMRKNFQADVLISDHTTLVALLKV